MQGLDKKTAEEISAFLMSPPAIGKFDALKTLLISTFGLIQADKDASLLAITGLGDRKPSGLFRYMNSLTTTDDQKSVVYRTIFLRQLPESVRVVLARDPPTSITDRAKAADDILAAQSLASGIAAVSAGKWADEHIHHHVSQVHAVFTMSSLGRKHANVVTPLLQ